LNRLDKSGSGHIAERGFAGVSVRAPIYGGPDRGVNLGGRVRPHPGRDAAVEVLRDPGAGGPGVPSKTFCLRWDGDEPAGAAATDARSRDPDRRKARSTAASRAEPALGPDDRAGGAARREAVPGMPSGRLLCAGYTCPPNSGALAGDAKIPLQTVGNPGERCG
jgi:hypothetical protein